MPEGWMDFVEVGKIPLHVDKGAVESEYRFLESVIINVNTGSHLYQLHIYANVCQYANTKHLQYWRLVMT